MGFAVSNALIKGFQIECENLGLFRFEFILKALDEHFLADDTGSADKCADDDCVSNLDGAELEGNVINGNGKNTNVRSVKSGLDTTCVQYKQTILFDRFGKLGVCLFVHRNKGVTFFGQR